MNNILDKISNDLLNNVEEVYRKLIKVLLALLIISILLALWKRMILYISFYSIIWGLIPLMCIAFITKIIKKYKQ